MKKYILIAAALVAAFGLCISCKGGGAKKDGPEATAEKIMKSIQKGDWKAYADTFNLDDSSKQMIAGMAEEKMAEKLSEVGGAIKSYEVGEPVMKEDGKADVTVKMVYADGSEGEETFNLVNVDGKWLQEMDK